MYQTVEIPDGLRYLMDLNKRKPICHKIYDVCIIPIGMIKINQENQPFMEMLDGVEMIDEKKTTATVAKKNVIKILKDVLISNDVYIFGYPTSIGLSNSDQYDKNKPLIIKGIVANVNFPTESIILDCPVY